MPVSDGFTYTLSTDKATITAYDPTVSSFAYAPTIPLTLDGYAVVAIGTNAFYAKSLTAVTFNHAISVGNNAFDDNPGVSVTLNANVTKTGNLGDLYSPFYACALTTKLNITTNVTSLGNYMFAFSGLTQLNLPATLLSVGDGTFTNNSGLTAVTIPTLTTSINQNAFSYSTNLNSITFDHAMSIGNNAFEYNKRMSVTLDANVTRTGVAGMDYSPFYACGLTTKLNITTNVTAIPYYLFAYSGLTELNLPASLLSIGDGAFNASTGLSSVTIPAATTSIGVDAFSYSTNLATFKVRSKTCTFSTDALTFNRVALRKGVIMAYAGTPAASYASTISTGYNFLDLYDTETFKFDILKATK